MPHHVTPGTLDNLKQEAQRWLKALRAGVAEARARLLRAFPNAPRIPTLRDVQHALAREHGYPGWAELKHRLPAVGESSLLQRCERVAEALVIAYRTGEPSAMRIVWDCPFTDRGLAQLAALDGLFALNLDSDQLAVTGRGLAPLTALPHLEWLGFDARDDTMPFIAALPHLRFLMCQDTAAGDDGFVALSRSQTIEYIWGRRCHNLRSRGFRSLADMPALRHLSVSCKNVDDDGLSALPLFPALAELMPMDVPDEGYRHIAQCRQLESLVLMYCRDTGDRATAHIVKLPGLKRYFASYTLITDRTPELLSGMDSLEKVTLSACSRLTNAGVARLARLPRLQEVGLEGMPQVTRVVAALFRPGVRVRFSL